MERLRQVYRQLYKYREPSMFDRSTPNVYLIAIGINTFPSFLFFTEMYNEFNKVGYSIAPGKSFISHFAHFPPEMDSFLCIYLLVIR